MEDKLIKEMREEIEALLRSSRDPEVHPIDAAAQREEALILARRLRELKEGTLVDDEFWREW